MAGLEKSFLEFFEPYLGAIFLVTFSFILVAIVRQDPKS